MYFIQSNFKFEIFTKICSPVPILVNSNKINTLRKDIRAFMIMYHLGGHNQTAAHTYQEPAACSSMFNNT
jgi:hypothetical protein